MTTRRVVLDVSSNNRNVDFVGIKRDHPEVVGAFVKATEGGSYVNPLFPSQIGAARGAGLLTGAYSFAHPQNSGIADVDLFLRTVGATPLELGTAWDCEVTDGLPPVTVLQRFLEDMSGLGRDPRKDLIYTGRWFWDPATSGSVPAHVERFNLWLSWYKSALTPDAFPVPWTSCRFWQFTDNYFGTGIDASVWMGTDVEWLAWIGGTPTPPQPLPPNPGASRYVGFPVVRLGAKDAHPGSSSADRTHPVTSLQNALNIVMGHESRVDPLRLSPDGVFGAATDMAVRRLQGLYHRTVDGVVGNDTWTLLAFLLTAKKR